MYTHIVEIIGDTIARCYILVVVGPDAHAGCYVLVVVGPDAHEGQMACRPLGQACTDCVLGGFEHFQRVDEEELSQGCEREAVPHDLEKQDREVKFVPGDMQ